MNPVIRRRFSLIAFRSLVLTALVPALSAVLVAQEPRGKAEYEKHVMPMLVEYCYDCHGDGMDKGDFALDKHTEYTALMGDKKLWDTVREHLTTHVMPPENKPLPSNEARNKVVEWIDNEIFWVDPERPDPGHITLRRLNREEYNNTVRDVFGVTSRPANSFPPDDTGYGYDNIGDVLSLSPLLMEKYMRAARKVAEEAVWLRPPGLHKQERSGDAFKVTEGKGGGIQGATALFSNGDLTTKVQIKEEGLHRLALRISATQAGPEKAKYAVWVEGKEVLQGEVQPEFNPEKPDEGWDRISVDVPLKAGWRTVVVRFLNDFSDPEAGEEHRRDRNLLVQEVEVQGPLKFRGAWQSKFLTWLVDGKGFTPPQLVLPGSSFDDGAGANDFYDDSVMMAASGHIQREVEIPEDGEYRLHVVASADQVGDEGAKFSLTLDGKDLGTQEVTAKTGTEQTLQLKVPLKAGKFPLKLSFLNDSYSKETGDRNLLVHKIIVEGPLHKRTDLLAKEEVQKWLPKMGVKVFRRPLDPEDLEKLTALAEMARADGAGMIETISVVTEAMLCSPKFLFRGGADPVGEAHNGSVLVDEFTLASRLSYFLWSSAPDDELLKLASEGQLRKNLRAQITRMIGDNKGWAMAENFAGQWLRLRDVELVAPNRRMFPEFQGRLAFDMKRESQLYFDHIYRGNRSVLEFLDSDYTFMNENLAKFYGMEEGKVKGKEFKKVSLAGTPRGGILTHAGILTLTSHPNRTSPVKRGQFVLENILGTPPPPAPQDVPAFGEDRGAKVTGTLRQRFEAHRSNPACASCHAFLDPMGFALENYDAIGRWREKDNKQPIDATGKLLTGEPFNGAAELRKVLLEARKNDFTRCLVENLLIYSLGRGLEYPDKHFVKLLTKQAADNGYKFQDIVIAVAESVPFQKMRAGGSRK
jgi:hypothetical protein